MTESSTIHGSHPQRLRTLRRRRRVHRWVTRCGLAVLLMFTTLAVLVGYYTRPKNLGPLLERVLSHEAGGAVSIAEATLSWDGRLALYRVSLSIPGLAPEDAEFARVFDAERIGVDIDLGALFGGVLRIEDFTMDRPRAYLIEDVDRGVYNVALLQPPPSDDPDEPGTFELKLPPSIRIEGARVQVARMRGGRVKTLDVLRLEGELNEARARPRHYDFALRQYDASANVQATLSGSVDTRRPALDLRLSGLRIDTAHRQLVPAAFRDFWDQLRPTGSLPSLTLRMDSDATGRMSITRAVLELHDVALSPPYAALDMPAPLPSDTAVPSDEPPRMTEVDGRFVLEDDTLTVENLTGMIEGVRYHANGHWGLTQGAAGVFEATTDPFTLDENPRYLASLPRVVTKVFDRLNPGGTFRASTRFERAHDDAPLEVSGVIQVIDGRAAYHKFPYPLRGLTGRITFDRRVVRIENIVGHGPGGGTVRIDGEVSPPGDGAAVRLAIEARGVPFDDHLLAAMNGKRRKAIGMFFDTRRYQQLVDEGLLRTSAQAAEALAAGNVRAGGAPVFDLGGDVNVDVLVDRPLGPDERYSTTVTVDADGLSALFKHWPYPVTGRGGTIVVRDNGGGVTLRGVVLEGPTGGRGVLSGRIETPEDADTEYPDLQVREASLPIDALLLSTIPGESRQIVSDLHPRGTLTGAARITRAPADRDTQWRVEATIVEGSIRPNDGRYAIDTLRGGFTLGNHELTLSDITGQRGGSSFTIGGRFAWQGDPEDDDAAEDATPREVVAEHAELNITANDLRLESALLDLLPPGEPMLAKLTLLDAMCRPSGMADAQLQWTRTPAEHDGERAGEAATTTYRLDLQPRTVSLDYKGDRITIEDMTGSMRLRPGRLDLERLAGRSGDAHGEVDGLVGLDGVEATAVALSATDRADSPLTRKLLPEAVARVLEAMSMSGRYRLRDARLLRRPEATADQSSLEFEGVVELSDTSFDIGLPITQMRGTLDLSVRQKPGDTHPALRFELNADELRAADRRIAPLSVTLSNERDPAYLRFDPLLGSVYGGVLVASGRVPLDPGGSFELHATLGDVAVEPFTKPATADPTYGQSANIGLPAARAGGDAAMTPGFTPTDDGGGARVALDERGATHGDAFSGGDRSDPSGLLSAGISLEAPLASPRRRRGRGALSVTDAELYDRPLSNALLRATNLSLPSGAPLDAASARFLIDGDTVYFNQLALTGPGLTIAGTGTMTWPGTTLNLLMVSRSGGVMPRLGPVSDLIDLFKNELIAIRVQGTVAEPQTSLTTLRDVRETIGQTFESFEDTVSPEGR